MQEYIFFCIIALVTAILLITLGILIYRGKTQLIHSYHQTKVKDKKAYGKAYGKALCGAGVIFIIGGLLPMIKQTHAMIITSIELIGLLALPLLFIFSRIQKKFNNNEL